MRLNRRSKFAALVAVPALLCGLVLVGGSPTQAEVTNPGAVTFTIKGGTMIINKADPDGDPPVEFNFPDLLGPWECNDGIDNDGDGFTDLGDDPDCAAPTGTYPVGGTPPTQADTSETTAGYQGIFECNDGKDQDLDGLWDHSSVNPTNPDSGYPNGCATSVDNDEDLYGQTTYAPPTFTGSVDAAGNISITAATFQLNAVSFDSGVGIAKAQVSMLPEGFPWTGTMNPNVGAGDVHIDTVKMTIKIVVQGIGSCRLGATDGTDPMIIDNLTTGTSDTLTGAPAAPGSGVATIVRGDFGIDVPLVHEDPDTESCATIAPAMTDQMNLPNTGGNDATMVVEADPIPLGYGALSGTVTENGSGTPLAGISVRARDAGTNTFAGASVTDGSGNFFIGDLPPGDYVLWYYDADGSHTSVFNGGVWPMSAASTIAVAASTEVDADQALDPAGNMSGTLTEEGSGTPLANATVRVRLDADNSFVRATRTAGDGTWSMDLAATDYIALFDDGGTHKREYAFDSNGPGHAATLTIPAGGAIVVDAALKLKNP